VRLLLSRDDVAQPLTVGTLFDAWGETVTNRYTPQFTGNNLVALELMRDESGRLFLYLRGAAGTIGPPPPGSGRPGPMCGQWRNRPPPWMAPWRPWSRPGTATR